jgi:hypothetical protein
MPNLAVPIDTIVILKEYADDATPPALQAPNQSTGLIKRVAIGLFDTAQP